MKLPNREPVLDNPAIHSLEHLMATFLRTEKNGFEDDIIYFGPMGCRTGMYLILKGNVKSKEIVPLMLQLFKFVAEFKGELPGNTSVECGNYLDHNINMAKWEAQKFYDEVLANIDDSNVNLPMIFNELPAAGYEVSDYYLFPPRGA